jgi:hypothetical protein
MPLDNKLSNVFGTKIAPWVFEQLKTRSEKNSQQSRDTNNLLYLANKTAWVRLISSVDLTEYSDQKYFRDLGVNIENEKSLAKQFVLYGGTSVYNDKQYSIRGGLDGGSYSPLGEDEIKKYGYRPMPGITSVSIETQGRLGSVKLATVNFKCWDKDQLDIIDTLYFKLGFTMFLEWGHTYYYPNPNNDGKLDSNKVRQTELDFRIDPFDPDLYENKEEIYRRISKNSRESNGNYDAMPGIVTNFNFSLNQDGGYDCTLKIISLGILASSTKINNPSNLPDIVESLIKQYTSVLTQIDIEKRQKEQEEQEEQENLNLTLEQYIKKIGKPLENFSYPSNVPTSNKDVADATIQTSQFGEVFIVKRLNGFISTKEEYYKTVKIKLDSLALFKLLLFNLKINLTDIDSWVAKDASFLDKLVEAIKFDFKGLKRLDNYLIYGATGAIGVALRGAINADRTNLEAQIKNADFRIDKTYKNPFDPNISYNIKIIRDAFAVTKNRDAVMQYIPVSAEDFFTAFKDTIEKNDLPLKEIKITKQQVSSAGTGAAGVISGRNGVEFSLEINVPITIKSDIKKTIKTSNVAEKDTETTFEGDVTYDLKTTIKFQDTYLIKSFIGGKIDQPIDFLDYQKALEQQNKEETDQKDSTESNDPNSEQTQSPLKTLSSFELILRAIQVYSLFESTSNIKENADLQNKIQPIELWRAVDTNTNISFLQQILSNGIFKDHIDYLINDSVEIENYNTATQKERFIIQAKYGFATNLMANKAELKDFKPVDFKKLLTTYVVPYDIGQNLEEGTKTNHPVYISLGALIMILNNSEIIYDTEGVQRPLMYLDFNPNHNFCLTHPSHLSTNPWTCLIPLDGLGDEDYTDLFDTSVLTDNKKSIVPLSGSQQPTPLFTPYSIDPKNRDNVSPGLLEYSSFKYTEGNSKNLYQGQIMNILLNIDYLVDLMKNFANKNEQKVYLKSFLEQVIIDFSTSTGAFNILRLSYNDSGNVYQIVDDQLTPGNADEKILNNDENYELPLFGKESIARSLEIRTDISTKLSSMVAISSNKDVGSKSTLSNSGDIFGYINTDYVDRYIPNKKDLPTGSASVSEGLKNISIQFNSAIESIYNSSSPAKDQVGVATNYYIEKMTKIKGLDPATRASAVIPLSVNFTTDGISGLAMGQAFTVPDKILPYTYNSDRVISGDNIKFSKVGFAIASLTHNIDSNSWTTSVRAIMIYLRDPDVYRREYTQKNREFSKLPDPISRSGSPYHGENKDLRLGSSTQENTNLSISISAEKTSEYIFGKEISRITKFINLEPHGPRESNQNEQWQSKNAWDLFASPFTPVYAIFDGEIYNVNYYAEGTYVWGWRFTLLGGKDNAWYTHLDRVIKRDGEKVKRGDLLGFVGKPPERFTWPTHLHIALQYGKLSTYLGSGGKILTV